MGREELIRKEYVFSGWVQGVGFRYRARQFAGMYGVTGWVRNQEDGTVCMQAQGTAEALDRLIQSLYHDRHIDIREHSEWPLPLEEEERCFVVKDSFW